MNNIEIIIILMAILAALYSIADKIRISYPILLVLAGLAIGFIPGLPAVVLDPHVVFLIFLPPLLFQAAWKTSWHDFKKMRRPIARMAIGLVFFTTAGIAVVAHWLIPGFSWAESFLLGAIVSPPDAVAATSALKEIRLPKKLNALIEGESLVNDASALIAYRYALAAAVSGGFVFWDATLQFFLVSGAGIGIGILTGYVFTLALRHLLNNSTVETSVTLMAPFVSYLIAEHFECSGVLAVVCTGLFISFRSYEVFSFETRMKMNSFWDTLVFLLNGFVFILIGLQMPVILDDMAGYDITKMIGYGVIITLVAVITRFMWVFPIAGLVNLFRGKNNYLWKSWRELFVLSWSGMRGIVSLAAALAMPLTTWDGGHFAARSPILFISFIVILITLVVQGLSLPYVVRRLGVQESEEKILNEERLLRLAIANGSLSFLEKDLAPQLPAPIAERLREKITRQADYLRDVLDQSEKDAVDDSALLRHQEIRRYFQAESEVLEHQRDILLRLHKAGAFGEEMIERLEQELDVWNFSLREQLKMLS